MQLELKAKEDEEAVKQAKEQVKANQPLVQRRQEEQALKLAQKAELIA